MIWCTSAKKGCSQNVERNEKFKILTQTAYQGQVNALKLKITEITNTSLIATV